MILEPGINQYPLPEHADILRVEVDFRTDVQPDEKYYALVAVSVANIKAARKIEDRKPADPVYYVIVDGALHVDPPPRREGQLIVKYRPKDAWA